jgi:aminoglycoside phosphotransferase family enzyme/predicted kinase
MLIHVVADQSEVFALLSASATHGISEGVKRVDTHGAAVFLAGPDVYKVKRAVKFAFMDFSSLEKRRAACEAEIRANQGDSSHIYLGVVPITRSRGKLHLRGDGEVVEWAVHMRRFDENATLDKLAQQGALTAGLVAALAVVVARAHSQAPIRDFDNATALDGYIVENGESLREMAEIFPVERVRRLTEASHARLLAHGDLLSERRKDGYVRRCHGDLHLRNIALIDGKPALFDALEFDEAMATGDVLYDLAFLIMDLWERGYEEAANAVLNRYLWEDREPLSIKGLALLPLFLSIRAAIRAKVIGYSLPQRDEGQRAQATMEAQRYFSLAERFLTDEPPKLIAIGGLSGTGKTTIAAMLAPHLGRIPGAVHIRSDIERKAMFEVGAIERLGEAGYTEIANAEAYARMRRKAGLALAAGFGVIADAVYTAIEERQGIERIARDLSCEFAGFWLEAPLELRVGRVQTRQNDASDADASYLRRQPDAESNSLSWQRIEATSAASSVLGDLLMRLDGRV